MEEIKIYRRPKLKDPYLLVAWPGMGEVSFKAAQYLVEKLKAQEFACLLPDDFFYLTTSVVQAGILSVPELPIGRFYYWKNPAPASKDLIIFVSNAQPDLAKAGDYCRRILELAKKFNSKNIIGFAAMPQPSDHTQPAGVWCAATSAEINKQLKNYNLNILEQGAISGMNGLFLGFAKNEGFQGFCLLGEIPLYTIQTQNPKASHAVLEALAKITGIKIDFSGLIQQAQAMEEEINKLLEYLKLAPAAAPIGEEEIEKIKKYLSQLTKLPSSVQENIESLFDAAKKDISLAGQLKLELDKWNVYKEYEDRFLDLFKKKQDKDKSN